MTNIKQMKKRYNLFAIPLCVIIFVMTVIPHFEIKVYANDQSIGINGSVYEFDKKSEYDVDTSAPVGTTNNQSTLGSITINGNINKTYTNKDVPAYEIADNELFRINFKYDSTFANASEEKWHLIKDNKKTINEIPLGTAINSGAIILQTSLNKDKWITVSSSVLTDIKGDVIYSDKIGASGTKDTDCINEIQLSNGGYYRIIVAYALERKSSDNKFLFIDTTIHNLSELTDWTFYYDGI